MWMVWFLHFHSSCSQSCTNLLTFEHDSSAKLMKHGNRCYWIISAIHIFHIGDTNAPCSQCTMPLEFIRRTYTHIHVHFTPKNSGYPFFHIVTSGSCSCCMVCSLFVTIFSAAFFSHSIEQYVDFVKFSAYMDFKQLKSTVFVTAQSSLRSKFIWFKIFYHWNMTMQTVSSWKRR